MPTGMRRYLDYTWVDFEFFLAPYEWHAASIRVKMAWRRQPSTHACYISPHRCRVDTWASKTVNFVKFKKINAHQGRIPCAILTKFSDFVGCTTADPRLDLVVFDRGVAKISLYVGPKKLGRCKNGTGILYHHSPCRQEGTKKFHVFVFVCSSRFSMVEIVLTTLPLRRLNVETLLISLDWRTFVVVQPRSALFLRH